MLSRSTDVTDGKAAMGRFDRLFWRRLWRIGKPLWISDQRWFPLGLLAATLLLTGSLKSANVVVSYVNRDMMTALADRNTTVFFHNVLLIVAYSLVAAPIMAVDGYVLQGVGLADLPARVGGLDAELKWKDLLSLCEQQKIAFARLLLDRPACAFLDEATSAVDAANEARLYEQLVAAKIDVVSVGRRAGLLQFHDVLLELLGNGAWRISRPDPSPPTAR